MAVRMANVQFADTPRHVGWREGAVEPLLLAVAMDGIDILDLD